MIFRPKASFENLDQYLARRDYKSALEAIVHEISKRPNNFNVLLRQAEVLALSGDRAQAVGVYEKLARHFIRLGFYARAIAVANKIEKLDPTRGDLAHRLAAEIKERQEAEGKERARLHRAQSAREDFGRFADSPAPIPVPELPDEIPPEQAAREVEASRLFGSFPQAILEEILSSTSVQSFAPGDLLVEEGQAGSSLFLIAEGEVEVRTHDPNGAVVALAHLGPGEFFGEVSILTGLPRTATVVAAIPTTVIEIHRTDVDRIAGSHPEIRDILNRFLKERAQKTVDTMVARMRTRHE